MNIVSNDRLKAFLDRTRNKNTQQPDNSDYTSLDKRGVLSSAEFDKFTSTQDPLSLSSRRSLENNFNINGLYSAKNGYSYNTSKLESGSENLDMSPSVCLSSIPDVSNFSYDTKDITSFNLISEKVIKNGTKGYQSVQKPIAKENQMNSPRLQSAVQHENKSSSNYQSEVTTDRSKSRTSNRIADFLKKQQERKMQLRTRGRSVTTDKKEKLEKTKNNELSLSHISVIKPGDSASSVDRNIEPRSKLNISRISNAETSINDSNHFDIVFNQEKNTGSLLSKPKKVLMSQLRRDKEITYEETEHDKRNENSICYASGVNSTLRSKSPVSRVLARSSSKGRRKIEHHRTNSGNKKTKREESGSKLQDENKLFNESSKKLGDLYCRTSKHSDFKTELRSLINLIKEEKKSITAEVGVMAKELTKYKKLYNTTKQELDDLKWKIKAQAEVKALAVNSSLLNMSKTMKENSTILNMSLADEKEKFSSPPPKLIELVQYVKELENINVEEPKKDKLLSDIEMFNTDLESLLNKTENTKTPKTGINKASRSLDLRKTPINTYILNEMNLKQKVFYPEANGEERTEIKPTMIDMLTGQREIIFFLMRKLEVEEEQRLRTEEQAAKMMGHMEKTVKQLETKGLNMSIRKKDLNAESLNSSINNIRSRSTSRCEVINQSLL